VADKIQKDLTAPDARSRSADNPRRYKAATSRPTTSPLGGKSGFRAGRQGGDSLFASTFDQVVKNSFRIANRVDIVPTLPPPVDYEHVLNPEELNPVQLLPLPPKVLVKFNLGCEHSIVTYMYPRLGS
jgi:hypothetical protein